jgi:hypothetical protein
MNKLDTLSKLLSKLKNYSVALIGIEVSCTALIGLGASQVNDFFSAWTLLIIICSVILIVISSFQYNYLKDFPTTLVESIKSDFSSQEMVKDYSRISIINDSIAKTLITLNSQTCQLQEQADGPAQLSEGIIENILCEKGIQKGISNLIDSFLKNLHNITESSQSKFTVGIYLDRFLQIPSDDTTDLMDYYTSGTFLLKDDLCLKNSISSNIFDKQGASGIDLEIQNCIKSCFNNTHSQFYPELRENKNLSAYANMIPVVCDEEQASGVLFIIANKLDKIPNDFDEVTKIYNRIIANWFHKYNDCIQTRKISNALKSL